MNIHIWCVVWVRYGQLPVVYQPKAVGMVVKWAASGLIRKLEFHDRPKADEFFQEDMDDTGKGQSANPHHDARAPFHYG